MHDYGIGIAPNRSIEEAGTSALEPCLLVQRPIDRVTHQPQMVVRENLLKGAIQIKWKVRDAPAVRELPQVELRVVRVAGAWIDLFHGQVRICRNKCDRDFGKVIDRRFNDDTGDTINNALGISKTRKDRRMWCVFELKLQIAVLHA